MQPEFILHFKGRYTSETYDQNFLWKFGSAYVMDNHRAALWCWLQHIKKDKKYNLLHIDKHYDCLRSRIDDWLEALPQGIESLTFKEYLCLNYLPADSPMQKKVPIVRFDNYLSIFLIRYANSINKCTFATHRKGEQPSWGNKTEIPDFQLVSYISHSLGEGEWIINVDLDYFFYENYENKCGRLYSDEYIDELFQEILKWYKAGKIAVITLCISPETCGGWEPAEILASRICKILGLPFSLP